MPTARTPTGLAALATSLLLAACGTPVREAAQPGVAVPRPAIAEGPAAAGAGNLVIVAMTYLDRPYQSGGQSAETGFDCSGFTRHLFGQALGIELPRNAQDQARAAQLRPVQRDALQAGDLVFFDTQQRPFSHVGLYLGDGRFIHAPRTGAMIRTESLSALYWSRRYNGARRAIGFDAGS